MFVCMGIIEIHSSTQQIIEPIIELKEMKFKPNGTGETINTAGYKY